MPGETYRSAKLGRVFEIAAVATLLACVAMLALTHVLFVAVLVAEYGPGRQWLPITANQYMWGMIVAGAAACLLVNGARLSFAVLLKLSPAAEGQPDGPAAPVDTPDPCWTETWLHDEEDACRCNR